jgi:hypothetical protein
LARCEFPDSPAGGRGQRGGQAMAATTTPLTEREIAAFKRDGFFIRRGILSPQLCAAARDRLWELNETRQLDRADPSSWLGPLTGDDLSAESSNARSAYRWNCRVPGGEDVLKDLLPRNPAVLAIVEQLLGAGRVADPRSETRGTRGVYCTLPMGDRPKARNSSHIDDYVDSRGRIDCVAYIDDTLPGGGATWPSQPGRCCCCCRCAPRDASG